MSEQPPQPPQPAPDVVQALGPAALQVDPETNLLTDILLPIALTAMLGSLVWFLLDIRDAEVGGPTRLLRWVFGFFMVAVVGIARIRSREGAFDAAPYALALLAVMGLFGFLFAFGGGAFGGGYGGERPWASLVYNYTTIALIWFGGNYIVQQTTLDPDQIEGEAGFLSSEDWEAQGERAGAVRRPNPGRAVMVLTLAALGLFGYGHFVLVGSESVKHAFVSMIVFLLSALAVLAMSALAGLEVYVRSRGARVPASLAALWLALALPLAVVLVGLAHVVPKPEVDLEALAARFPSLVGRPGPGGNDTGIKAPWGGDEPGPGGEQPARTSHAGPGEPQGPQPGKGPNPERKSPQAGEPNKQDAAARQPAQSGTEAGQGREGGPSGKGGGGAGQGEGHGSGQAKDQPPTQPQQPPQQGQQGQQQSQQPPPPEAGKDAPAETQAQPPDQATPPAAQPPKPPPAPPLDWLKLILVLVGLGLVAALVVVIVRLLRRRRAARPAADEPVITRNPFVDPFAPHSPLRGRPPVELVRHVYRAFGAYTAMVGAPRRPQVTAHDYLRDLPPSLESWRREIENLTDLYAAAEYTPESVDEACLDELRAFWERLMVAVRAAREGRG